MPYRDDGIGYQKTDTSKAAADTAPKKKLSLRERVLELMHEVPFHMTTEEIAERLGRPYRSVQPRLSELRNEGKVEDSGHMNRGTTDMGATCIRWKLK